jgi:meso-butanediol dehydrogenase / (S,S)-butanediol dehydrogenase / diacetyl reductase
MSSNQSDGAVVTGAASGIGRAIAGGLAADGFSVVIADLDEVKGRAVAEDIAASHQGRVIFQRVDVTDRASVSAAIDACTRQFGSIKVMVNNAGFNKPEAFLEASEVIWRKIMDVNALGVMIGIQEAAKAMIAAGTKGKIINTASIAGRTGYADFAPYSASKFAVVALTHAGARALAARGITVNAFAPGVVARCGSNSTRISWRLASVRRPARPWRIFPTRSCSAVPPSPETSLVRSGSWLRRHPIT